MLITNLLQISINSSTVYADIDLIGLSIEFSLKNVLRIVFNCSSVANSYPHLLEYLDCV